MLTWTSGAATGKQMVVQAVGNAFPDAGHHDGDIVIQTPGGGSGPNVAGCQTQYGTNWYAGACFFSCASLHHSSHNVCIYMLFLTLRQAAVAIRPCLVLQG